MPLHPLQQLPGQLALVSELFVFLGLGGLAAQAGSSALIGVHAFALLFWTENRRHGSPEHR